MKKLIALAMLAAIAAPVFAQEAQTGGEDAVAPRTDRKPSDPWPAFFALCELPDASDIVGLRLTIPYSSHHANVTGLDLGFWGKSHYFEGIQVNIIRSDVRDNLSGFQVGIYNSAGSADPFGVQVGFWNESNSIRGIQAGLVNVSGETEGLQFGLINRSETMYGYQIGLINIIREAEFKFFPIVNIGF